MLKIGNGEEFRVVEDRGRKLEGDAVLAQIRGGLDLILLELKLPLIQNWISCTMLQVRLGPKPGPRVRPGCRTGEVPTDRASSVTILSVGAGEWELSPLWSMATMAGVPSLP